MIINFICKLKDDYEVANNTTITYAKLAEISGCSEAAINKYRNREAEIPFLNVLRLVRFFAPDREEEIMNEICLIMLKYGRLDNIRWSMEYCSATRLLDTLKIIVDSQLKVTNAKNKEWAKLYDISYKFQKDNKQFKTLFKDLEYIHPTFVETKAFYCLLKAIFLYMFGEMKHLNRIIEEAQGYLLKIKNGYIKYNYSVRLDELLAIKYLYLDVDLPKSTYHANNVLNSKIGLNYSAHSNHILATTFLLADYDKSLYYYDRYIKYLSENGRLESAKAVEHQDKVYLKIIHGIDLDSISTHDISELAHLEARWGDKKKALALLEEAEKLQGKSLYKEHYRAIALNDPDLLFEVLVKFIDSGNKLHAHVVLKDLQKHFIYWKLGKTLLDNLTIK